LVGDCPAIDFHRILLAVTWTIVANAGIFSLLHKRSKLTYYVHSTLMWIVTILTFGGTFTLIGEAGIRLETEDGARRFTHNLLGLLLLVIVGALSLLGYTTHYLQETLSVRPKIVATLRKVHVVLGYIVMILAKIIVQIGWWSDKVLFYISLGLEIIILLIWIWRYCCPSLLEHKKSETSLLLSKKS
jgi:membrane protease YdiL (CAAX protease family)